MSFGEQTFHQAGSSRTESSGWAIGLTVFAGVLMIIGGAFQFIQGLAAVLDDEYFVIGPGYAYELDISTWGWIHMVVGSVVVLAGFFLFTGNILARSVGVAIASLAAIVNFFYIPYYPVWSILVIAVSIGVIWALTAHGRDMTET